MTELHILMLKKIKIQLKNHIQKSYFYPVIYKVFYLIKVFFIINPSISKSLREDEIAIKDGWYVDQYDEALAKAKLEKKPLFIDFTGVYCANCRVMERRVFPKKEVKEQLDKMVLARLYVDKKDSLSEAYARLQFERYNQATQPYYVVLNPEDESTLADTGGYIPKGFHKFLTKGMESYTSHLSQ